MKKIVIIGVILCLCSCVHFDRVETFQVINYSDEGQIIYYSCSDSIGSEIDSLTFNPYFKQFDNVKSDILNENKHIDKNSFKWIKVSDKKESIVKGSKDGLIRFFFISDSTFLNNSWDTIVKYQMYNRKLVFSEEDLEHMNWVIEYQ